MGPKRSGKRRRFSTAAVACVFILMAGVVTVHADKPEQTTIETYTDAEAPWWDHFPRIVETSDLPTVLRLHGTIAMNGAHTDPGWGLWAQKNTIADRAETLKAFHAAGLKSISYYETFGTMQCYAVEVGDKGGGDFNPIICNHWGWQVYGGGRTAWTGIQTYYDDEEIAAPYTRTHPRYGSPPMTYPDGTLATGYDGAAVPPNSRVLDACGSKNILGELQITYHYNRAVNKTDPTTGKPAGPVEGLLYVPETGKYASLVNFFKDSACPMWADYTYASALQAADAGCDGMWTDNFSAWDSWSANPVRFAFGEWSVARFRDYLADHFTPDELLAMGVEDVATFDIRAKLRSIATQWGWDGVALSGLLWQDSRWLDEPLWRAYAIYKRQVGTEALTDYYNAVKTAARKAGRPGFLVAGNDIPLFNLGWARGNLDMVSSELSGGWGLCSGPRGLMWPPVGRFAPFYKLAREHAACRFVNVWMYKGGYEDYARNPAAVSVLYYEMLANHALPMFHPGNAKCVGTPAVNQAFFKFVSEVESEHGARVPVEDVGVYYSSSSILARMTPGGFLDHAAQPHQFAFWGWTTALGELHYQYRAVPEWKLNRRTLASLRVLVIPEATVLDPSDVEDVLVPWVREDGGQLIITGASGRLLGESGNFDLNPAGLSLAPLTGVSDPSRAPTRVIRDLDDRRVLYYPGNMGMEYYLATDKRPELLPKFKEAMDILLWKKEPLVLKADGVSSRVGLTLYEDAANKRLFVDVNNLNVDLATDRITPTEPLTFAVRLPESLRGRVLTTRALCPGARPRTSIEEAGDGYASVTVSPVRFYASIVIERRARAEALR